MAARDPVTEARDRALRYLEGRDRSRREVESRLRRYGYEAQVIAAVLEWLEGLGYLDDARFATTFAREKARAGWGTRRIRAGLAAAGVSHGVVADALDAIGGDLAGGQAAAEDALVVLVCRRFARDREQDPAGTDRRAAAFLQRRGHDWETVRRVLKRAFDGRGEQGFR